MYILFDKISNAHQTGFDKISKGLKKVVKNGIIIIITSFQLFIKNHIAHCVSSQKRIEKGHSIRCLFLVIQ